MKLPCFTFGTRGRCSYCGDSCNGLDHVIAVSYQKVHTQKRKSDNGPITFSCSDCNSHLSNRYFESFKKRCEWNHWRIEKKCEPVLWHSWEMNQLDQGLKDYVKRDVYKRKWLRFRADYFSTRDYLLSIESLLWEIQSVKANNDAGRFIYSYFSETLRDLSMLGKSSMREEDSIYGL